MRGGCLPCGRKPGEITVIHVHEPGRTLLLLSLVLAHFK